MNDADAKMEALLEKFAERTLTGNHALWNALLTMNAIVISVFTASISYVEHRVQLLLLPTILLALELELLFCFFRNIFLPSSSAAFAEATARQGEADPPVFLGATFTTLSSSAYKNKRRPGTSIPGCPALVLPCNLTYG